MASAWQAPDDWQKDGSSISGISSLKTGAWTSLLSAKELRNGKEVDVVIKTFSAPQDVLQDPDRVTREREKFLASARLQKQLSDAHAAAWVPITRISEDPNNTSFSMDKCGGASLQDMLDRKVHLTAKDLYEITLSVLQGFDELMQRHKRSHGSLKASDVLNAPGHIPPYLLADPSPKGDPHSANDLYALGLILFQLVEHKPWDPLSPIIPTSNWARFGSKRDRWIQFLNMILSPNGCQESLATVRREALRLQPAKPIRNLTLAATALFFIVISCAGVSFFSWPYIRAKLNINGGGGGNGGGGTGPIVVAPTIDPQVKADWTKSHDAYLALSEKWTARDRTDRYDHAQSSDTFRASRAFITDLQLTDNAAYQKSMDSYHKATAKLQEALDQYAAENVAGLAKDQDALAGFNLALNDFSQAKSAWDDAVAKFDARHDHTRSLAFAQATQPPTTVPPPDASGRAAATTQLLAAAARYSQALAMAKEEELAGKTVEQAKADFADARAKYQAAKDRWDSAAVGISFDIATAKTSADKARTTVPDQLVLTDVASYQQATDAFTSAAAGYTQALALLDQAKRDHNAQESDATTFLARAADALDKKDYAGALAWYRKAADAGNAGAMFEVGLFYETGRGTEANAAEAAQWYQRAADLNHTSAMVNLGLLYERGQGVEKDAAKALALYKKAADLKDVAAMRNIAYLYDNAIGVPKDPAESLKWNRQAADLKDPSAMFSLGIAYEQGKGVTIDYAQAIAWYTKAADLKNPRAMNSLGVIYETGRGVKTDPALAMTWYKKAADLNYAPAMCNVGGLYDNGIGVPLDHAEAFKWFHKGADLGHPMSMFNLAVLYETGRGTATDLGQALDWYRKAANQTDDPQARKQALDRLNALGFQP